MLSVKYIYISQYVIIRFLIASEKKWRKWINTSCKSSWADVVTMTTQSTTMEHIVYPSSHDKNLSKRDPLKKIGFQVDCRIVNGTLKLCQCSTLQSGVQWHKVCGLLYVYTEVSYVGITVRAWMSHVFIHGKRWLRIYTIMSMVV